MDIGKNSAQTVKSENAKLVIKKSGIVRRISLLKTTKSTKAFPTLPMMQAKTEIKSRAITDSLDKI